MDVQMQETYRVRQAALAIDSSGSERVMVSLPVDAVVILLDGPLDGLRLVEISWAGKSLLMFTQDMRERCDLLPSVS